MTQPEETMHNVAGIKPSRVDGLRAPQHRLTYGMRNESQCPKALFANLRIKQIERVIRHRHGNTIPDTDDADRYVYLVAQHLREVAGHRLEWRLALWCAQWAPDLSDADIKLMAARVLAKPRRFSAETMAELLGLTYAERTELKITTIGAKDVDAAGRAAQYAAKKRSRDRASAERRRRARGAVSRPEYLARNPISQTCPWKQEGIHRRTWERRRARAAASSSPAIASTATPSPTILSSC